MKKSIFYFAFAAMAAVTLTACSSSDDDNGGGSTPQPANLPAPATATKAATFKLETPLEVKSASTEENERQQLSSLEITESSQLLLELKNADNNGLTYIMEKAVQNGDEFTMAGTKVSGKIKMLSNSARQTRASGTVKLAISITIKLESGVTIVYETDGSGVTVTKTEIPATNEIVMTSLARTWSIQGASLLLKSTDVEAYKDLYSHSGVFYLSDVLAEAESRGVSFTESERQDLNRQIKSITLTKSGNFILTYVDGSEDVASWSWADSQKTTIRITLKNSDMGNKFINNNTTMSVAFEGQKCNLTMKINFDDSSNKKWDASLKMILQAID